jgi:hypothetical protein
MTTSEENESRSPDEIGRASQRNADCSSSLRNVRAVNPSHHPKVLMSMSGLHRDDL